MSKTKSNDGMEENSSQQPVKVHLPGFIVDDEIGLGDVIKRATSMVGIKPCRGCERRATVLNRWLIFTGRRHS